MTSFSDRCFHCGSKLSHRLSDGMYVCPVCGAEFIGEDVSPRMIPSITAYREVKPPVAVLIQSEIIFPEAEAKVLTMEGMLSFAQREAKNKLFALIAPDYLFRQDDMNPRNTRVRAELRVVPKGYVFR